MISLTEVRHEEFHRNADDEYDRGHLRNRARSGRDGPSAPLQPTHHPKRSPIDDMWNCCIYGDPWIAANHMSNCCLEGAYLRDYLRDCSDNRR